MKPRLLDPKPSTLSPSPIIPRTLNPQPQNLHVLEPELSGPKPSFTTLGGSCKVIYNYWKVLIFSPIGILGSKEKEGKSPKSLSAQEQLSKHACEVQLLPFYVGRGSFIRKPGGSFKGSIRVGFRA